MSEQQSNSVSDALNYLATCADDTANAHYAKAYNDEKRKIIRAELMRAANLKTASERETYAYAQEEYRQAAEEYADACRRVEFHRAKKAWAENIIEVWRTQNANKRAAERVM